MTKRFDFLIVGGGITGLAISHQLFERFPKARIGIIEKEDKIGKHTSGRNSGVIHAGIYYEPNSLKSKLCIKGGKRLKEWVKKHGLKLNECGKLIVPTTRDEDKTLIMLKKRAEVNKAKVEIIDDSDAKSICDCGDYPTKKALWSPKTSVVNPCEILKKLENEVRKRGIEIMLESKIKRINAEINNLTLEGNEKIEYGFLFNCAGLYADTIAKEFGTAENYIMMPFRGEYWDIKREFTKTPKVNIYPVPDINLPFLGVHFTPNADNTRTTIGPTANLALGRENYEGTENIELKSTVENLMSLGGEAIRNTGNIRKYIKEQAFLNIKLLMIKQAKKLVPSISIDDIIKSKKVAIRPQLYDKVQRELIHDFRYEIKGQTLQILNAISPAFTASFEFADYIIDRMEESKH